MTILVITDPELLLKAVVKKTILVPGYTRHDGSFVPPHHKTVNVDPEKQMHHVLAGDGTYSQKKAHAKLSGKLAHWHSMSDEDKYHHILSSGQNIQDSETKAAAVSQWKKNLIAGKTPPPAQVQAYAELSAKDPAKAAKLMAEVKAAIGEEKAAALSGVALTNEGDKAKGVDSKGAEKPAGEASVNPLDAYGKYAMVPPSVAEKLMTEAGFNLAKQDNGTIAYSVKVPGGVKKGIVPAGGMPKDMLEMVLAHAKGSIPDLNALNDGMLGGGKPAAGSMSMPEFHEGKDTTGVKAYYEKIAAKVMAAAGDADALEKMKADGLTPNSKGKVTNTWAGKTANSKALLALHAAALAASGGKPVEAAKPSDASAGHETGEKVYLHVPFAAKETAKKYGAKWDSVKKLWYANKGYADGDEINPSLKQFVPDVSANGSDQMAVEVAAINQSAKTGEPYVVHSATPPYGGKPMYYVAHAATGKSAEPMIDAQIADWAKHGSAKPAEAAPVPVITKPVEVANPTAGEKVKPNGVIGNPSAFGTGPELSLPNPDKLYGSMSFAGNLPLYNAFKKIKKAAAAANGDAAAFQTEADKILAQSGAPMSDKEAEDMKAAIGQMQAAIDQGAGPLGFEQIKALPAGSVVQLYFKGKPYKKALIATGGIIFSKDKGDGWQKNPLKPGQQNDFMSGAYTSDAAKVLHVGDGSALTVHQKEAIDAIIEAQKNNGKADASAYVLHVPGYHAMTIVGQPGSHFSWVAPDGKWAMGFSQKQHAAIEAGNYTPHPAYGGKAPEKAVEQGPKEGDTKQGADGTLVFKDGHWHKQEVAAPAYEPPEAVAGWYNALVSGKVPSNADIGKLHSADSSDVANAVSNALKNGGKEKVMALLEEAKKQWEDKDGHAAAAAAFEHGTTYQKTAWKQLKAEHGDAWDSLDPVEKHAKLQATHAEHQDFATKNSAAGQWKAAMLQGKMPTPSQAAAYMWLSKENPEKAKKLHEEAVAAIGADKVMSLHAAALAKGAKAKKEAAPKAAPAPAPKPAAPHKLDAITAKQALDEHLSGGSLSGNSVKAIMQAWMAANPGKGEDAVTALYDAGYSALAASIEKELPAKAAPKAAANTIEAAGFKMLPGSTDAHADGPIVPLHVAPGIVEKALGLPAGTLVVSDEKYSSTVYFEKDGKKYAMYANGTELRVRSCGHNDFDSVGVLAGAVESLKVAADKAAATAAAAPAKLDAKAQDAIGHMKALQANGALSASAAAIFEAMLKDGKGVEEAIKEVHSYGYHDSAKALEFAITGSLSPSLGSATVKYGNNTYQKNDSGEWVNVATGLVMSAGGFKATAMSIINGDDVSGSNMADVTMAQAVELAVDYGKVDPKKALMSAYGNKLPEGTTKVVDGKTYVLKNGRWHLADGQDPASQGEAAAANEPVNQAPSALESLPVPTSITLSHTKFLENLKAAAVASGGKDVGVTVTQKWVTVTNKATGGKKKYWNPSYIDYSKTGDGDALQFILSMKALTGTKPNAVVADILSAAGKPVAGVAKGKAKAAPKVVAQAEAFAAAGGPSPAGSGPVSTKAMLMHGVKATPMDSWQQTGPQKGSNPGGQFKDKAGNTWYCKFPSDPDVVKNEFLAAKFYQMLGVPVPTLKLVSKEGKLGIASKWVDGLSKGSHAQLGAAKGVHDAFAIDAWLANWDVVGLSNDNLMLGKDGQAVHVDVGGSLVYRAQGGKKGDAFGDTVAELDSLLDPSKNSNSAAVFKGVSKESMALGLSQLNKLKPSQIEELVQKVGPGTDEEKAALAKKLIARRADILAKFKIRDQWQDKHIDESKLTVDAKDLPKKLDFVNWSGTGKGLSSSKFFNEQNTKDSEALIAFAAQGNLTALKDYQYDAVDKETGKALGKKPITDHPSKHVKEQWAGLVELLQSIAHPPVESLPMPSMGAAGSIEDISDMVGSFNPTERVETVAAEHRMGFFMKLGQVDDVSDLLEGVKWGFLKKTSKWVQDQHAGFSKLSSAVRAYISEVQASGWINHVFSQGKTTVQASGKGGSFSGGVQTLANEVYKGAVEIPEGTMMYRGMTDTTAGKSMMKQFMEAKPGLVIQNTDSMCTSYNENHSWGGDIQMKIRCPKGCKATPSFASGSFSNEHEITTLPGQRFVLLGVEQKGSSSIVVEVMMLPPDGGYVAELGKMAALGKAMFVVFKRAA